MLTNKLTFHCIICCRNCNKGLFLLKNSEDQEMLLELHSMAYDFCSFSCNNQSWCIKNRFFISWYYFKNVLCAIGNFLKCCRCFGLYCINICCVLIGQPVIIIVITCVIIYLPIASFDMKISVDGLFFIGSQLVALSYTGKVAVWQSMTQHWQVR